MKKVSLIYAYGIQNSGDMAINLGAIDLLLDLDCDIKAFSKSDSNDIEYKKSEMYLKKYYPEVKLYGGPFKLNRDEGRIKSLLNHFTGFMKTMGINEDKQFLKTFLSSDIIFFNGGNILRSETLVDYARLKALMYPLKIAREKKVPYIMLPHSASNINQLGQKLLNPFLKQAKKIFTREDKSYNYLAQTFSIKDNMSRSIDLAFFIKDNVSAKEEYMRKYNNLFNNENKKIAITLRTQTVGDLGELNNNRRSKIIQTISNTIQYHLKNNDTKIIIVVQTRKDKKVSEEIYQEYVNTGRITLVEEYDTLILREIYRNCDLLIGMRLHSIILALSVNTLAIGYFEKQWGLKNSGLMDKFNLPYKFVDENNTDLVHECNLVKSNQLSQKSLLKETIEKEKEKIIKELETMLQ